MKRMLHLSLLFFLSLGLALSTAPVASAAQSPQIPLNPKTIPQFVDPLPLLDIQGGATPGPMETVVYPGAAETQLFMLEFPAKVLSTTFVPPVASTYAGFTWVWGYRINPSPPTTPAGTYIGPVFVNARNTPTQIKFWNNLPTGASTNVLAWKYSTDQTLHWADPLNAEANNCATGLYPTAACAQNYDGSIPAVVHLHGGEVPPVLDGGPDAWVTSDGSKWGHGYYTKGQIQGTKPPDNFMQYRYPNSQEAAPIWFHDHVLGITRLNVYAGLAGGYIITDNNANPPPDDLNNPTKIIPIVIQDRMFDTNGQLFFPADAAGGILWTPNPEHPYWVPEFVGDTIVVNGKTWPFLEVGPNKYRFLFLNGSNARTYELFLPNPVTGAQVPLWVIENDGGYLNNPIAVNKLTIMPGERYGVIIDFSGLAGANLILKNTGRTPYPKGAPPNGTTVGQIMQFRVRTAATLGVPVPPVTNFTPTATANLRLTNPMVRLTNPVTGTLAITAAGTPVATQLIRQLTLNEVLAPPSNATDPVTGVPTAYPGGPMEILVNNSKWMGITTCNPPNVAKTFKSDKGTDIIQCYSELPNEGETEVWEIVNLTADAHPMHLHAVQFQILNRQNFNTGNYLKAYAIVFKGDGAGPPYNYDNVGNPDFITQTVPNTWGGNPNVNLYLQGPIKPPAAQEIGWKDTVVVPPGMVTRLAVRWAPTDLANNTAPADAFFPFNPDGGHGYVWHCHIIDHEDNEMMRPTSITARTLTPPQARTYIQGTDY